MPNPFDQFDSAPAAAANPFDAFDAPADGLSLTVDPRAGVTLPTQALPLGAEVARAPAMPVATAAGEALQGSLLRTGAVVPFIAGGLADTLGGSGDADFAKFEAMQGLANRLGADAAGRSKAGAVAGDVLGILPKLAAPELLALDPAAHGIDLASSALQQNKGMGTAYALGGLGTAAGAAGLAAPVSVPGNVLVRALTGGALNAGLGLGEQAGEHAIAPDVVAAPTAEDALTQGGIGAILAAALGHGAKVKLPEPTLEADPAFAGLAEPAGQTRRPAGAANPGPVNVDATGTAYTRPQGANAFAQAVQAGTAPRAPGLTEPVVAVDAAGNAATTADQHAALQPQPAPAPDPLGLTAKLRELIAADPRSAREGAPILPKALPAPAIAVDRTGQAMTTADRNALLEQQRTAAEERAALGLTPDIQRTQGVRWAKQKQAADAEAERQARLKELDDVIATREAQNKPARGNNAKPDETVDDALTFLAKSGGLDRRTFVKEGLDPAAARAPENRTRGGASRPLFRAQGSGGMSLDDAARTLWQHGYLPEQDNHAALDLILGGVNQGEPAYSIHRAPQDDLLAMQQARQDAEHHVVDTYDDVPFSRKAGGQPDQLPARALSQREMIDRGAGGHLSRGFERYIPIDKLDGLEPEPSNNESADGKYHPGRPVTDPIETKYDAGNDAYMVYAGNHRIAQAKANGQTHIRAFVEPDSGHGIGSHPLRDNPDAVAKFSFAGERAHANNASGESSASLEAINRLRDEKAAGQARMLIDRDGSVRPLTGVDAVDTHARAGQVIVQKGVGREPWTVLSADPALGRDAVAGKVNAARVKLDGASDHAANDAELPAGEYDLPGFEEEVPHADQQAVAHYNAALSKYVGAAVRFTPAPHVPEHTARVLAEAGRIFDVHPIVVRNETPRTLDINGVTLRDGVMLIDENATSPALTVAHHELVHQMRRDAPDLYDELVASQQDNLRVHAYAAVLAERAEASGEKPRDIPHDEAREELVADAVGDAMGDPAFIERLARQNPGLFRRFARYAMDFLARVSKQLRSLGSSAFLRDVDAFRTKLSDVLERYAQRQQGEHGDIGSQEHALSRKASDERDLVAVHNTTGEKVLHALRMGGMAVPSIAVTRAEHALTNFGDITLLAHPDLVDPKQGAKAFGADIYSPRYPAVDYKITPAVGKALDRTLAPFGGLGGSWEHVGNDALDSLTRDKAFQRYVADKTGSDAATVPHRVLKDEAQNLLREAGAQERLFKGYTANGRSYKPHTLENVVAILKKELRGGENFNYGVGSLRAHFTPQFRSLAQMRSAKDRLTDKATFDKVKEEVDAEFFGLVDALRPHYQHGDGNRFGFADTVISALTDAAKQGVPRALREYGIDGVDEAIQRQVAEFLGKLRTLPTEYFEVKQLRGVGVGEFQAAVVPDDTSPKVRDALEQAGLKLIEYPRGDEAARQRAVHEFVHSEPGDALRFSRKPSDREASQLPASEPALPRFNRATALWQERVGTPVFKALGTATKALVANDLLKRHGLNLAEDMPPAARDAWRQYRIDIGKAQKAAHDIAKGAVQFTPAERALVSDYIEREMVAGVRPPEHVVKTAQMMTAVLTKQSDELVSLGMLSPAAKARWEGRYLPRFYEKHILANPFDKALRAVYLQGIKGNHLRGRGLFESIAVKDVPKYQALGWELRGKDGKPVSLAGRKPTDPVQVWRDFTPAERAKMGEVRDAFYRFARGYTDTQRDIALGRLFARIADTVAREDNPGGWVQVPDTTVPDTGVKRFGKLAGQWVPGDVLAELKAKTGPSSELAKVYLKALSLWKEGKTSLNPVSHVNNMVSNVIMADLAGLNVADPRTYGAYAAAFKHYKNRSAVYQEAQEAGLFGGEWFGNEIHQYLPIPGELKAAANTGEGAAAFAHKALGLVSKGREAMGRAYQAEDAFFKFLLYLQGRSRGLAPDDAVEWAQRWVFDYSTAAPGVRKLKNTAIPFANYGAKAIPALAFAATHYPWRVAKWMALLGGFALYSFQSVYGDDKEEGQAMEGELLPDYLRGGSAFFGVPKALRLPWNDETGAAQYVDISRFLPMGDLFDTDNQMGGVPLPAPFMPSNPLLTTAYAMLANKDSFTGRDITRDTDTAGEATSKRLGWLYRQMAPNNPLVPGTYNFNRLANAAAASSGHQLGPYTGTDYEGVTMSPGRAVAQTAGVKLRSVDLAQEQERRIRSLAYEIRELRSEARQLMRNGTMPADAKEQRLAKIRAKLEARSADIAKLRALPVPAGADR